MERINTLAPRSLLAGWRHSLLIGIIQMLFMAVNVRNMTGGYVVFAAGFTFVNTWIWVYIVRTVMHSSFWEKFAYAVGSSIGVVLGVLISHFFIKPLAVSNLAAWAFIIAGP